MANKWKVGDWCFFDYELVQIQKVENGNVRSVSTGIIGSSGNLSERCFPLSLEIVRLSGYAKSWSDKLRSVTPSVLNYPDIHRKLVEIWVEGCESIANEDAEKTTYESLRVFCEAILERLDEAKQFNVGGVRVLR